jgi:hypothetical protein
MRAEALAFLGGISGGCSGGNTLAGGQAHNPLTGFSPGPIIPIQRSGRSFLSGGVGGISAGASVLFYMRLAFCQRTRVARRRRSKDLAGARRGGGIREPHPPASEAGGPNEKARLPTSAGRMTIFYRLLQPHLAKAQSGASAGRSSGFRVILSPPFPFPPREQWLAVIVAGYSGASAADSHGLPFQSRLATGTYTMILL